MTFGRRIKSITLTPSGRGRFEVMFDGELVHSKATSGEHADADALIALAHTRI